MIELPPLMDLAELTRLDPARSAAWVTDSVLPIVKGKLSSPIVKPDEPLALSTGTLVAIGGGNLLDRAKVFAHSGVRPLRLIAVPSIWGSGAEASKIAVLDHDGKKEIRIDAALLPNARVIWPQLAQTVPPDLARYACGDAWSHAFEGFCSPLASEPLRSDLAVVIKEMLKLPLAPDPRWFELSSLACAGQAQAGVGLIHGLAHTLEAPLRQQFGRAWHHARLCSLFLLPVLTFNKIGSEKWSKLSAAHGINSDAIFTVAQQLFDSRAYQTIIPILTAHWRSVLRDPCSRTNSVLVRPDSLEFFRTWRA